MTKTRKGIIIGVDGGGTKTESLAVDMNGRVLGRGEAGSSNLRNSGIKKSVFSITKAIKKSLLKTEKEEILSVFIGLAAFDEEFKNREKEIIEEIVKYGGIFSRIKNKIKIDSDQITAFRSGTDKKEGVVVIAGTGCVARGWKNKKDIKTSSWGWFADEGSACWVGRCAYQRITKMLDDREKKSYLADLIVDKFKAFEIRDLSRTIYQKDPVEALSSLSLLVDEASKKGDREAEKILQEAGKELALSTITVINKLNFKKDFPLVLIGGMFNSQVLKNVFKKEIKKEAPNALFILPEKKPVFGAVKMAMEKINENKKT